MRLNLHQNSFITSNSRLTFRAKARGLPCSEALKSWSTWDDWGLTWKYKDGQEGFAADKCPGLFSSLSLTNKTSFMKLVPVVIDSPAQ